MRLKGSLILALVMAAFTLPAYGEYTSSELLDITLDSLSYDKKADTAHVCGAGKIMLDGSMGEILARRAAVADAQRGFLILRRGIIEGKPFRPGSVSGRVPPFRIVSEYIRDGVYFVEAETRLSELMGQAVKDDDNSEDDTHDEKGKDYSVPDDDSVII